MVSVYDMMTGEWGNPPESVAIPETPWAEPVEARLVPVTDEQTSRAAPLGLPPDIALVPVDRFLDGQ
jgi:hypothetical protein